MTETPLIEACGVSKHFVCGSGRIEVLRGIDLRIAPAERVAIVGASGAGKTTLLHVLGGVDRPSSGRVLYAGADIFALPPRGLDTFRNRTVGFVFQFNQLLPEFSALENVMMPALIAGVPREGAATRAAALLEEVGLGHRLRHKPGELSGGEQQRTAIARALTMNPQVLLADEPTGNLDSATSDEIFATLDRLHRTRGLTMAVVTHSERLAGRFDRILRVADGVMA